MDNVDALRREAECVKERLRQNILELRDILKRAAYGISESNQTEAEEAVRKAERRIEETVWHVEKRFEKAIGLMAEARLEKENLITREFDFSDFANVEVDCAFRVEISQSDSYQISVCTREMLVDYLNVSRSGNTLKMSLKPHRFQTRPVVEARIEMPLLKKIRLSAATRGIVRGFSGMDDFDVNLSGNSALNLDVTTGNLRCEISGASRLNGKMKAADVDFVLSGASRAELSGVAQDVILSAWGASRAGIADFQVRNASIHLKGASEAIVNATGKMDIDLGSGSHLTYTGNPAIRNISVTGASSLYRQ